MKKDAFGDLGKDLGKIGSKDKKSSPSSDYPVIKGFEKGVDKYIELDDKIKALEKEQEILKNQIKQAGEKYKQENKYTGTVVYQGSGGKTLQLQQAFTDTKIPVQGKNDDEQKKIDAFNKKVKSLVGNKVWKEIEDNYNHIIEIESETAKNVDDLEKIIEAFKNAFGEQWVTKLNINRFYVIGRDIAERIYDFPLEVQLELAKIFKIKLVLKKGK